jgi:hypothetical protein
MRTLTLAIGMVLSLSGFAFAGMPDPANEGAAREAHEVKARLSGNHQETRADRQIRDGRQETRGASASHASSSSNSGASRSRR